MTFSHKSEKEKERFYDILWRMVDPFKVNVVRRAVVEYMLLLMTTANHRQRDMFVHKINEGLKDIFKNEEPSVTTSML